MSACNSTSGDSCRQLAVEWKVAGSSPTVEFFFPLLFFFFPLSFSPFLFFFLPPFFPFTLAPPLQCSSIFLVIMMFGILFPGCPTSQFGLYTVDPRLSEPHLSNPLDIRTSLIRTLDIRTSLIQTLDIRTSLIQSPRYPNLTYPNPRYPNLTYPNPRYPNLTYPIPSISEPHLSNPLDIRTSLIRTLDISEVRISRGLDK